MTVQAQSVAEAKARISETTARLGKGVLAFDADGTLWTGDVADDVVHRLLAEKRVHASVGAVLRGALQEAGETNVPADVHDAFREVLRLDREGRIDHGRTCELVGCLLGGWSEADFHAFCIETLQSAKLNSRLIPEAWEVLRFAEAEGHAVVVVSASPIGIVQGACEVTDGPKLRTGVGVRVLGGVYQAAIDAPIPYNEGKVVHLSRFLEGRPVIAAFGDNRFDVPMLKHAVHAFAVRPKPALREAAVHVPGIAELVP